MNKRQRKKAVMKNVSKLYDVVFERDRFRKDMAIVGGVEAHKAKRYWQQCLSPMANMNIALANLWGYH